MATRVWTDQSGDWADAALWNPGTVPGSTDTAIIENGYSFFAVTVGTGATDHESDIVGNLTLVGAGNEALLEINAEGTLTVETSFFVSNAVIELAGILNDSTIVGSAEISSEGGTLSHDTVAGSVVLFGAETLHVVGGLDFDDSSGAPVLDIPEGTIAFLDRETLSGGVMRLDESFPGVTLLAGDTAPLTFASDFTVEVSGVASLVGSFVNDGTIDVEGDGEVVVSGQLSNSGVIELGLNSVVILTATTTAQLLALTSGMVNGGGQIFVNGVLDNTGATLDLAAGTLASVLQLQEATLLGGTLIPPVTATRPTIGVLSGVTVQGTLDVMNDVSATNGLVLEGQDGSGPGAIVFSGALSTLTILDSETLANAFISDSQSQGNNAIVGPGTGTLTLGSHVVATIGAGAFSFSAGTVVNDGTIKVANSAYVGFVVTGTAFENAGVIDVDAGGTLALAATLTTAELAAIVASIEGSPTVEVDGTLLNAGAVLSLPDTAIVSGDVIGGTVVNTGSLTVGFDRVRYYAGATLDNVTFQGPLIPDPAYDAGELTIANGLTLENLDGTPGGTIAFSSDVQMIAFENADLPPVGTLVAATAHDVVIGTTIVPAGFAVDVSGGLALDASIIAGTIDVYAGGMLSLTSNFLHIDGVISVAPGAMLAVNQTDYNGSLSVSGPGALDLASGSTLDFNSQDTTGQLLSFLSLHPGIQIDLEGVIANSGSVLAVTVEGPLSRAQLDGTVMGGTIVNEDGGLTIDDDNNPYSNNATLENVVFEGKLNFGTDAASVFVVGSLTLLDLSGGPGGIIDMPGTNQQLVFENNETLNDAAIAIGGNAASPDAIAGFAVVDFGPAVTLDVTGVADLDIDASAATILVESGGELQMQGDGFRNTGRIEVAAGGVLYTALSSLSQLGTVMFSPGSTLYLSADEAQPTTTAEVLQLIDGQPGVTLDLDTVLDNTGSSLVTGPQNALVIERYGTLAGGTLVDGGNLTVLGGGLSGVSVLGPLMLAADGIAFSIDSGTTIETASGAPGTIVLDGNSETLALIEDISLNALTILVQGRSDVIAFVPPLPGFPYGLSFGPDLTLTATGSITVDGSSVTNDGLLSATGTAGLLVLEGETLVNDGVVSAGCGDTVALDVATLFNAGTILIGDGGTLAVPGTLDVANAGVIALADCTTLAVVGAESTAQLLALMVGLDDPGGVLSLAGTLDNAGASLDFAAGGFGNVVLDGTIMGGTLAAAGAMVCFATAALQSVTFEGPLNIAGDGADVTISGSLVLRDATGDLPGTLAMTGDDDTLDFVGAQTLDDALVLLSGHGETLDHDALTFGPQASVSVTGAVIDSGSTLVNDGTIALSGASALFLDDASFVNTGIISVGSGDVFGLDLAASDSASLPFFDSGSVDFAAGAILVVGGTATTTQLSQLLGTLGDPDIVIDINGVLLNSGAVLAGTAGGAPDDIQLDADVVGGTIAAGSFSLDILGGEFDDVTFLGTLVYGAPGTLDIADGLTLADAAGSGPGAIQLDGSGAELNFSGDQTLAAATVAITGSGDGVLFDSLTLAQSLSMTITGAAVLAGATLVDEAPIILTGPAADLRITTASFADDAVISVGAGDELDLEQIGDGSIQLAGTGAFAFAPGATLAVGGDATTGDLLALIGSIVGTQTGVAIRLDGTIENTASSLVVTPSGLLSDLILDAVVIGGTLSAEGGALSVLGGEFQSVVMQGPLDLTGTQEVVAISGGLALETGAGLLPGTLMTGGNFDTLSLLTDTTLANLLITGDGENFSIEGQAAGALVLAPSVVSDSSGQMDFSAGMLTSAGTLFAATPGAAITLQGDSIVNTGTIIVAAGAALALTSAGQLNFSNSGSVQLDAGATLMLGGTLTTAQFEALAGTLIPADGVLVDADGELLNQGATLTIGPADNLSDFLFSGADLLGGTVVNAGTLSFAGTNSLDGVAFAGALTLAAPNTDLAFDGTSSVASNTISIIGTADTLAFEPGPTLSQEIDGGDIAIGTPGTADNQDGLVIGGSGTITFETGTTLDLGTGATVLIAPGADGSTTFVNAGTIIYSGSDASITAAPATAASCGCMDMPYDQAVFINDGLIVAGAGGLIGSFTNDGTVSISGPGDFVVAGTAFANLGTMDVSGGATLDFQSWDGAFGLVALAGTADTLRFDAPGQDGAIVSGFGDNDALDFTFMAADGTVAPSLTFSDNTLVLQQGSLLAEITLPAGYIGADFSLGTDALGGTEILTDAPAPCFLAGTRIRTTRGDIAVEHLAPGMMVPNYAGTLRPVRWIGQRRVDCRRHPRPELVQPIRVRAGAFGAALPMRDLLLSPDHSLFVDGVLIPVQHLQNGATIVREHMAFAQYYHVELSAHDVLLAEGLPAESYLDTGNRLAFANGFAGQRQKACAPLRQSGPTVERTRRLLLAVAHDAGYRPASATPPVLEVDNRIVPAAAVTGDLHRYLLPAGASRLRILSSSGIPAGLDPCSADHRQVGAAIAGIVVHGKTVDLSSPLLVSGFWSAECRDATTWRWTDGRAELDIPVRAAPSVLELLVLDTMAGLDVKIHQQEILDRGSNKRFF